MNINISIKNKILLTILVVVVLGGIGTAIYLQESYKSSEKGLTKKYFSQIQETLGLDEKRVPIIIHKTDFNSDGAEDYIGITGIEKHDEEKNKNTFNDSTLELYQDVEVIYIDGNSNEVKKYACEMSFYPEVKLEIKEDEKNKYIFISDQSSGNVVLLILKDNEFHNVIKDSIKSDLNGYTINVTFDKDNTSKIKIKLDNYARSYLNEINDEKELVFEDTSINSDNYRPTYLANKFCRFRLEDEDQDNILDLVGVQNILYLIDQNSKELTKTAGVVETLFKINDGKISYNKTDIKVK